MDKFQFDSNHKIHTTHGHRRISAGRSHYYFGQHNLRRICLKLNQIKHQMIFLFDMLGLLFLVNVITVLTTKQTSLNLRSYVQK